MSEIVNTNIGEAGTTTSGVTMDSKFDDARTASLNLDAKNVRSEGIDRRQLEPYYYPVGRLEPIVYMERVVNNDTSIVTFVGQDGKTPAAVAGGVQPLEIDWTGIGGVVMKAGDLLRINYNIVLYSHNMGHTDAAHSYWAAIDTSYVDGSPASITAGVFNATGICAMFFPVWDTSTTTGWEALPGRAPDLNTTFGSAPSLINIGTEGYTDGCLLLSLEGRLTVGITLCNRSGMVSTYYKHNGYDMTINKIRLNTRMPVIVHSSGGTNREILVPDWTTFDYQSGQAMNANFAISLERGSIGAVIMRGASV